MGKELNFKIPAMCIKQKEDSSQAIYIGVVKASDFVSRPNERFIIDYYKRSNSGDHGYQRPLAESSVEKIKNYILQETPNPLLPTALLLNSRGPIEFKKTDGPFGFLEIKQELHIIDGQHRFEAWKSMMEDVVLRSKWGDYEFPVVILSNFEELKEIEQFFVINARQKRIKTDLAQRNFLQLASNEKTKGLIPESSRWQLFATKIVDQLNEKSDSIWNDKIILPDDSKDLRKAKLISQASFVSSLKPLFVGSESVFAVSSEGERPQIEKWGEFIVDFWKIVKKVYPEAIQNPHDYVIQKTVGVFSLHLLLAKTADDIPGGGTVLKEERKKAILDRVEKYLKKACEDKINQNFWRTSQNVSNAAKQRSEYAGAYSSSVGHNSIVSKIMLGL
jgi:DGQHR domain-containing protein